MLAVAGGAVGAFEVRVEVVLFWVPAAMARTFTLMVQVPPAGTVPPDRDIEEPPSVAVVVPPQVLVSPLGVATTRPPGRVSVNATPVSPSVVIRFVMVNVRVVEPPMKMLGWPNAFEKTGTIIAGVRTLMLAVAAPAVGSFEVRVEVVLFWIPAAMPRTLTDIVQLLLAETVPPDRDIEEPPAVAVVVPPQVLVSPLGVATASPEGSVSVNATLVSPLASGFVMVNVRVVELPTMMLGWPNAFENVGAVTLRTSMLAVAAPAVGSFEVRVEVVLFWVPAVMPRTFTLMVQLLLAETVPPDRDIEEPPAVAVVVPPQVLVSPFGVATASPDGSVSVNAALVSPLAFGFVMVNVRVVELPTTMLGWPNAFDNVGVRSTTVMPAVAAAAVGAFEVRVEVELF